MTEPKLEGQTRCPPLGDPLATSGLRTLFRQRRAGMHFWGGQV